MTERGRGRRFLLAAGIAIAAVLSLPASAAASGQTSIKVLSNRADLISAGNALVAVHVPTGIDPKALDMTLGRRDITRRFKVRRNGRFEGLVRHLKLGPNLLRARLPNGEGAEITITNHPTGGPVFSGRQVHPWFCEAGAKDRKCDKRPTYTYLYESTDASNPDLQPYDPQNPPSDVATTTTDGGVTVPFIVRLETGYVDRDQYKILTLFRPSRRWKAWAPQRQFNHKLLITHGGGCGVTYGVGNAPLDDYSGTLPAPVPGYVQSYIFALGRGFAVATTALDNNGHNCNIVTQAESLLMAKERVIERYGTLRYTIGTGCSGGSLTQQWVANAYPGIYQGLLPTCSFPDTWTSATQVGDYHLLRSYFEDSSHWGPGIAWAPAQWGPIEGNPLPVDAIVSDIGFFNVVVPTNHCGGVTDQQRYDPQTNPGGVRCGIPDYMINVLGPRRKGVWSANEKKIGHGFGGLPIDNVGVQYGLAALETGEITADQFVDLNSRIGSVNIDITPIKKRLRADQPALRNAYRTGGINETTNLNRVAIIDGRGPDPGAAHDSYRAFAIRARLDREHGTHANQAIWEGPTAIIGDLQYTKQALVAMDLWLAAVRKDHSHRRLARKVIADKPADIGDACYDGNGNKVSDGLCGPAVVPVYGTPRTVAGDAITTDANKCRLKPLRRSDYGPLVIFTDAQFHQLRAVFPNGVCDFTKPAVSQQPTVPWLTYQDARRHVIYGGRKLGPAPKSIPIVTAAGN